LDQFVTEEVMLQLDLFEKDEIKLLLDIVRQVRESQDGVRKKVFAEIAELKRLVKERTLIQ
jgi:hypothetical protein